MRRIEQIFKCLDTNKSGSLDLKEFKHFTENLEAKRLFKNLVYENRSSEESQTQKLPFELSVLLEHLTNIHKRTTLIETIDQKQTQPTTFRDAQQLFLTLFKLNAQNQKRDLVGMQPIKEKLIKPDFIRNAQQTKTPIWELGV